MRLACFDAVVGAIRVRTSHCRSLKVIMEYKINEKLTGVSINMEVSDDARKQALDVQRRMKVGEHANSLWSAIRIGPCS